MVILLSNKYARLITPNGDLYKDRVVWIKLEGIEGSNFGLACVYTPNSLTNHRYLWHIMGDFLPKDCNWITRRDCNYMIERSNDKYNDCGRAINGLERFSCNEFLIGL